MARRTTDAFATRTAAVRASLTHGITESVPASLSELVGPRGLRLLLNAGTLVLVLALPYSAAMSARAASPAPDETMPTLAALVPDGVGRAQPISRGVIAGSRSPVTVNTDDVRPVIEYEVKADDTLSDIADGAGVPLRALAFANGITKADEILHVGQKLTIPPGEGALYTVQAGDTVESIAGRFKVDPRSSTHTTASTSSPSTSLLVSSSSFRARTCRSSSSPTSHARSRSPRRPTSRSARVRCCDR